MSKADRIALYYSAAAHLLAAQADLPKASSPNPFQSAQDRHIKNIVSTILS